MAHCTYRYILEYIEEYIYFHLNRKTKVDESRIGKGKEGKAFKIEAGKLCKVIEAREKRKYLKKRPVHERNQIKKKNIQTDLWVI